jgi:hypothetical protein
MPYVAEIMLCRMMGIELEMVWKEAVLACLHV